MTPFWLANAILDGFLSGTAVHVATPLQMGLVITDIDRTVTTLSGNEPSAGEYARQNMSFGSISGDLVRTSAAIVFPTAQSQWGTVLWQVVLSNASGGAGTNPGKVLYMNEICPRQVNAGDFPNYLPGIPLTFARSKIETGPNWGQLSDAAAAMVLAFLTANTLIPTNTPVYLGLSTTEIFHDGTGISEPVGNGYQRQQATFASASEGVARTSAAITFPTPTGDWGNLVSFGIWDQQSSGGNLIFFGKMCPTTIYGGANPPQFKVGGIRVAVG